MIEWKRLPEDRSAAPFDCGDVLLAKANGEDPPRRPTEFAYTVFVGFWDEDEDKFWVGFEDSEERISHLAAENVSWWAPINLPAQ